MKIMISILLYLGCFLKLSAQQVDVEYATEYFDVVEICYDTTTSFTLKEGQLLKVWSSSNDKFARNFFIVIFYKILVDKKRVWAEFIINRNASSIPIDTNCFTNFNEVYCDWEGDKRREWWRLTKIQFPRRKGKTILHFSKKKEENE